MFFVRLQIFLLAVFLSILMLLSPIASSYNLLLKGGNDFAKLNYSKEEKGAKERHENSYKAVDGLNEKLAFKIKGYWNISDALISCANKSSKLERDRCLMRNALSYSFGWAVEEINESKINCANSSVSYRMRCRLEEYKKARNESRLGLSFVPQECISLAGAERAMCLSRYAVLQPCINKKNDKERFLCARVQLGLNASAKELVEECKQKALKLVSNASLNASGEQIQELSVGACVASVRARVYYDALFRLDNLQQKAMRLSEFNVSDDDIAGFLEKIEGLKLKFALQESVEGKKEVLKQAMDEWREFFHLAILQASKKENVAALPK